MGRELEGTNEGTAEMRMPDSCSESSLDETWYRIPESRRASGGVRLSTVLTVGSAQLQWVPAGLRVQPPRRPYWSGPRTNTSGTALVSLGTRLVAKEWKYLLVHTDPWDTTMREGLVVACADRVERGRLRPLAAFPVVRGGIMNHQYPLRGQAGRR